MEQFGGREWMECHPKELIGKATLGLLILESLERSQTLGSLLLLPSAHQFPRNGKTRKGCQFPQIYLGEGGQSLPRWCTRHSTGSMEHSLGQQWLLKQPLQQQGKSGL